MRVIIDTNVLVSAALRDRDPETVILFVAEHPDFQWLISDAILEEIWIAKRLTEPVARAV